MNEYLRKYMDIPEDMYFASRIKLVTEYSWAIPSHEALKTISKYSPLVEIGCGTAYWAHLLQDMGCTILPFDKYRDNNPYKHKKTWVDVYVGDHNILPRFSKSVNLFLCWPPYNDPMAYHCLTNFNGGYVLYIGEDSYGCTADAKFSRELDKNWELKDKVYLPQWSGLHDNLYIYKRI